MKASLFGVAASAFLAVSATQGVAATLVIDDFTGAQWVTDEPFAGFVNTSTVESDSILGGSRTLTVENTVSAPGASLNATELRVASGALGFSNTSGSQGNGYILYDANGTGLGADFLSYGADPYFNFEVISYDHDTLIGVYATDAFGNTVSYLESLYSGFNQKLTLTELTDGAVFDWTNVFSLEFFVSSNGVNDIDGRLGSITLETVPLPASGLLLLGGVTGLAALRRRKKAA